MSEKEDAFVGNAADSKQVRAGKKKARRREKRDLEDIKKIASTPEGKRFFQRYLMKCHVNKQSYEPGEVGHGIYFREGQRSIGTTLQVDLAKAAPGEYMVILQEGEKLLEV